MNTGALTLILRTHQHSGGGARQHSWYHPVCEGGFGKDTLWECEEGAYKGGVAQASCVEGWVQHVRMWSEETRVSASALSRLRTTSPRHFPSLDLRLLIGGEQTQTLTFACKLLDSGIP